MLPRVVFNGCRNRAAARSLGGHMTPDTVFALTIGAVVVIGAGVWLYRWLFSDQTPYD